MKRGILILILTLPILLSSPVGRAATIPPGNSPGVIRLVLEKLSTYTLREIRQQTGRKLTLKEKLTFLILKRQVKRHGSERVAGFLTRNQSDRKSGLKKEETKGLGKTAFILGIASAATFVAGLLVPALLLVSLLSAILAIALGTVAYKRNPSDGKAKAGKLMGWISLGLFVILAIMVIVALASFSWW